MGLDAAVRCRFWEEGRTRPCPFPQRIQFGTDLDLLELDLPWEGNEEMHRQFDRWRWHCCAHENMWLANERISNWSGVRAFQQALRSAGEARFSTLLAATPMASARAATQVDLDPMAPAPAPVTFREQKRRVRPSAKVD